MDWLAERLNHDLYGDPETTEKFKAEFPDGKVPIRYVPNEGRLAELFGLRGHTFAGRSRALHEWGSELMAEADWLDDLLHGRYEPYDQHEAVRILLAEFHVSPSKVAEVFGMDAKTVRRIADQYGIERKRR